jgi:hypothetical protein
MKIRPVGAEVFSVDIRTDRQIDMTEIIVAFRSFPNPPEKSLQYLI